MMVLYVIMINKAWITPGKIVKKVNFEENVQNGKKLFRKNREERFEENKSPNMTKSRIS